MIQISIIVPIYNVAPFIERCIHSIMEQEECGATLECIIIDDCSPDNSMEIIHTLLNAYNGNISFVLIEHQFNLGLSAARNSGIDIAQGDYLFFIDSDDWLPSDSISKFVSVIKENPRIDIVIGNHFNTKKNTSFSLNYSERKEIYNIELRKDMLNYQSVYVSAWNKMISIRFFSDNRNRFPRGLIYEDIYWTYYLFKEIESAIILPDVTYIYENNIDSITNTCKEKVNAPLYLYSYNRIIKTIMNNPYYDLYPDTFIYILPMLITNSLICQKHHIINKELITFNLLKKRVVKRIIKDKRIFLSLYITILVFPPFTLLFRIGWVRRHYYIIEKIGRVIANFLEKFHRNP